MNVDNKFQTTLLRNSDKTVVQPTSSGSSLVEKMTGIIEYSWTIYQQFKSIVKTNLIQKFPPSSVFFWPQSPLWYTNTDWRTGITVAWPGVQGVNRGQTREKLSKVLQSHFHCFKFNILLIHCQFTKRFESLPKKVLAFENYELQNCQRHLPT